MEYVAPKLVSLHQFQFQPVVFPKGQEYWWLGWTEGRNIPKPEVNNFTGPKGRLKWINPVDLSWHEVRPCNEQRIDAKDVRLARKGWKGISVSSMSAFEEAAIMAYLKGLGDDVYKMRPYMWDSDARPGDIGTYAERIRGFYLRTPEQWDGLVAVMEALPKRTVEMYVDHRRMNAKCKLALRGLNWHVFPGQDADLLSIEESVASTALMLIRLCAGVPKPV